MSIISSEQKSIVRKKIIAANWKMNLTHEDVLPYLGKFLVEVGKVDDLARTRGHGKVSRDFPRADPVPETTFH